MLLAGWLLTLKALRALQSADVILYDRLVSPEILELARREAKRMLVGKAGGVFTDDMIDAYIELKMAEVERTDMTPHPVEFDMYYSV